MDHNRRKSFSGFGSFQSPPVHRKGPVKANPFLTPQKVSKPEPDLTHLQNARVVQNTLVYVVNVPMALASEKLLRSQDYFGQYGSITKLVLNKPSANHSQSGCFGVYITYASEEEAAVCIKACNEFSLLGSVLNATYGTTKYCSFFLSGKPCPKPSCLFLHRLAPQKNTLTRDWLPQSKHIQPENAVIDRLQIEVSQPPADGRLPPARVLRRRVASLHASPAHTPEQPRKRCFSRDQPARSRFGFLVDSDEEPLVIPDYCSELNLLASPSKTTAELNSHQLEELLDPASPDRWAADVLQVRPRRYSEITSTIPSEDELLLVSKKESA